MSTIKIIKEEKPNTWYRERFDRDKQGIICNEIARDMQWLTKNLTTTNEEGKLVGKYNIVMFNLQNKPKTLQRRGKNRSEYKKILIKEMKKRENDLLKFKDTFVLVYLCFYLRKEKFMTTDLDNYSKTVIDALKEFIGDDSKIVSLILEKKELGSYPKEDMDFVEQALLVLTDPKARTDIIR